MQIYKVLDFRRLRDEEGLDEATISQIKQDQTKLETNLKAMNGVNSVKLDPAKGEISLSFEERNEPLKASIESVVSKSGFTLGAKG
jgi:copper chaperone CopZ